MEKRKDFGLTRRRIPVKFDVDKCVWAMKNAKIPEDTRIPNDSKTKRTQNNEDHVSGHVFRKATMKIKEPGTNLNPESSSFDFGNQANWGEALPLFDDEDPDDVTGEDFDKIVYTKLAKFNEMKRTGANSKEKSREKYYYIDQERSNEYLKLAFKFVLICSILFGVILYAICHINNRIH